MNHLVKVGHSAEANEIFAVFYDHNAFLDGEPWHYWTYDPDVPGEPPGLLCPWGGKHYVNLDGFIVSAD